MGICGGGGGYEGIWAIGSGIGAVGNVSDIGGSGAFKTAVLLMFICSLFTVSALNFLNR